MHSGDSPLPSELRLELTVVFSKILTVLGGHLFSSIIIMKYKSMHSSIQYFFLKERTPKLNEKNTLSAMYFVYAFSEQWPHEKATLELGYVIWAKKYLVYF